MNVLGWIVKGLGLFILGAWIFFVLYHAAGSIGRWLHRRWEYHHGGPNDS